MPWTPASAQMADCNMACSQLRRNCKQITMKGFWGYKSKRFVIMSVTFRVQFSSDSFRSLNAEDGRSSSFLTCPHVWIADVAALNHVSMLIPPSHRNSCHQWPFFGCCTTYPCAGLGAQASMWARITVNCTLKFWKPVPMSSNTPVRCFRTWHLSHTLYTYLLPEEASGLHLICTGDPWGIIKRQFDKLFQPPESYCSRHLRESGGPALSRYPILSH
jgi:hypothetical protein